MDIEPQFNDRQQGILKRLRKLGMRHIVKFQKNMNQLYNKLCEDCRIKAQANEFDFCSDCEEKTLQEMGVLNRILDKINARG